MDRKECFGILDKVFPVGEHGLREVRPGCFDCHHRILCLKEALDSSEGLAFRMERVQKAEEHGLIGRLKRWSQRKTLSRMMEARKKGGK